MDCHPSHGLKRLSVDRGILAKNRANDTCQGPLSLNSVADGKTYTGGREIEIRGPSRLVYRKDECFDGFTSAWIETEAEVYMTGITAKGELVAVLLP